MKRFTIIALFSILKITIIERGDKYARYLLANNLLDCTVQHFLGIVSIAILGIAAWYAVRKVRSEL